MVREDFYSGEPVEETGSSKFAFPSANNIIDTGAVSSEVQAANMASFGRVNYDYDPAQRAAAIQTAPVNLGGGYGGYFNPYQPNYGGGIGTPPPWYANGGYSPYGNPQPSYGYYRPPQQQQRQEMPTCVKINPINMSGEYLPNADYEATIQKMQMEYFNRQQDIEAKQMADRENSVYGYGGYNGYNYYGIPYYNPYQYNSLNNEFMSRIEGIREEARNNRLEFQMNLSRLAHKFSREEDISDQEIRERYTGKTVDIPRGYIPDVYYEQVRFSQLVPFDNSQMYRDYYASLKREFNDIIPPDSNLKTTFANMGIMQAKWELEDEQHRRRDAGALYNSGNAYKYYVRQKAKERYMKDKGVSAPQQYMPTFGFNPASYVANNPILSKATTLADDGTLNVSISLPANVGSHKGEVYTVNNSQEAEYNEKRERFGRFLDSIPGNIYLDQQKAKKMEEYSG